MFSYLVHVTRDRVRGALLSFGLLRFELAVYCIPLCAATLLTRFIIEQAYPSFTGYLPEAVTSTFSFPAMLFLGFMYQGVISDFQESQKLPGHIADRLEALIDRVFVLGRAAEGQQRLAAPPFPGPALHRELLEYTLCLFEYLGTMRGYLDMLALTSVLGGMFEECVALVPGTEPDAWEIRDHILQIRSHLIRLQTIKRTDFMANGYQLMVALTLFILAMFTLGNYTGAGGDFYPTMYLEMASWNYLFLYFLFLYQTLEDPFNFQMDDLLPSPAAGGGGAGGGGAGAGVGGSGGSSPASASVEAQELHALQSGASDVDVTPLLEVVARLVWYCEGGGVSGGRGVGCEALGLSSLAWGGAHPYEESLQGAVQGAPTLGSVIRLAGEGDRAPWQLASTIQARAVYRDTLLGRMNTRLGLPTDHGAKGGARELLLKRMASANSLRWMGGKAGKRSCPTWACRRK